MITKILEEDLQNIHDRLKTEKSKLEGKNVLVTGFAGSLGYVLMSYFRKFGDELGLGKVYGVDTYIFGKPQWTAEFDDDARFSLFEEDITKIDLDKVGDANVIFHMASLASPVYYRLHPIETIDADVLGLRRLLDYFRDKDLYDLLFFSTSEVYGNPDPAQVPTSETYWGNVNTSGPRACYDESKRFGETLCYNYYHQYHMPITVVRPFNSYGPGLRTNDKRVVADFAMNICNGEDLVIYSNGKATRTFCYSTDSITAIIKCALFGDYGIFNIGCDKEEITIDQLAEIYKKVGHELTGYEGTIKYQVHEDKHYLTDNPQRRCPNLTKINEKLNYVPQYDTETGVRRYLIHLLQEKGVE